MRWQLLSKICAFICFFCICIAETIYELVDFSTNSSALSITGFSFNDHTGKPEWFETTLGKKAMFWNKTKTPVYSGGIQKALNNFRESSSQLFQFENVTRNNCFIEMIGFVRLGVAKPFMGRSDRQRAPSIGKAMLRSTSDLLPPWLCYYRGLYTNWPRVDSNLTFWTVMFFCPTPTNTTCLEFKSLYNHHIETIIDFEVNMFLEDNIIWHAMIQIKATSQTVSLQSSSSSLAVCTVWPYIPKQNKVKQINNAIIFEFLRYYTKLGIKLIIYDRDGNNLHGVMNSSYAYIHSNEILHTNIRNWVEYYNYTIQSRLFPLHNHIQNTSSSSSLLLSIDSSETILLLDHDKMLSYSQCRFIATTKYHIKKILIIDFDEFIFCKHVETTLKEQMKYLEKFLITLERRGKDQVMLSKTTIAPRTLQNQTISDCIEDKLYNGKESIYDCFASLKYSVDIPNVKSIQLNRKCPFSGLHYSCSPCYHNQQQQQQQQRQQQQQHHSIKINKLNSSHGVFEMNPVVLKHGVSSQCDARHQNHKFSDCICESTRRSACELIHLSIQQQKYDTLQTTMKMNITPHRTELWDLMNS